MKTQDLPLYLAILMAAISWQTLQAQTAQIQALSAFTTNNGESPYANLCLGPDGKFYGTTTAGGTNGGFGTVFSETTNGLLTSLVSFADTNGSDPQAGLTVGPDGHLYGTTTSGGSNGGYGTIFSVTTNGLLTSLASFANSNGAFPYSALTLGKDGNFYGTTFLGGSNDLGTVFQVTTNGTLTSFVSFDDTNGANPHGGLLLGSNGVLYGTTTSGGTNGDYGTVFEVATNGLATSLASLDNTNGAYPRASLIAGPDGALYGTTYYGGSNGLGTVFRVTANGALTSLVSFVNSNGAYPVAGLTLGSDGNFYGTTSQGGRSNVGTAFALTTNGNLTTLASFANTNGANPYGGFTLGADGNFYGTAVNGGTGGSGTVLKMEVPPTLGSITINNHVFQGVVYGLARPSLQIQATTNLAVSWTVLTNLTFTNGTAQFTDPALAAPSQKFYRAVLP